MRIVLLLAIVIAVVSAPLVRGAAEGPVVKPEPQEITIAAKMDGYVMKTRLSFPLRGEWSALNAARSPNNGHAMSPNQRHAVDWIVRVESGHSYTGTGDRNEDYPAYHQDFLAPADGVVVTVVDGHPDNAPNVERDKYAACGNFLVLQVAAGEFAMFCHAAAGLFRVKVGDRVRRGQVLGLVGNSGNSTEPHLHFQMMDDARFFRARTFPAPFDDVVVNGVPRSRAVPGEGDKIRAADPGVVDAGTQAGTQDGGPR